MNLVCQDFLRMRMQPPLGEQIGVYQELEAELSVAMVVGNTLVVGNTQAPCVPGTH